MNAGLPVWLRLISGIGKANIIEEGDVLTLICWGAMVQKSIDAIKASNLENGEVELIDLRTLNPIDWNTIYRSVEKTGKLLIVHEDLLTGGVGAEIAAKVSDNLFEDLDGPIKRVAAQDCHVPYNEELEAEVLPQSGVKNVSGLTRFIFSMDTPIASAVICAMTVFEPCPISVAP